MHKIVVYGPPGCGKTATIIRILNERRKGRLSDCIVISYSRAAVRNIKERIGVDDAVKEQVQEDTKYFRTVHSICSRLKGLTKNDFLDDIEVGKWMQKHHIDFGPSDGVWDEQKDGRRFLAMMDFIRSSAIRRLDSFSEEEMALAVGRYISQFGQFKRLISDVRMISGLVFDFESYKRSLGKMDYTDILLFYLEDPVPPPCKVLVVDEFQDMSPLIYKIIKYFENGAEEVYYAGDPQQSIYSFMGAEPKFLLDEMKGANEIITLDKSYRLPPDVWKLARTTINNTCNDKIGFDVDCSSYGRIRRTGASEIIRLVPEYVEKGTLYVLTRTNYQKNQVLKSLMTEGLEFSELTGNRKWTAKMICIANALWAIKRNLPIKVEWLKALIKQVPSRPYLKPGIKTKVAKDLFTGRETVSVSELYGSVFAVAHPPQDLLSDLGKLRLDEDRQKMLYAKINRHPGLVEDHPKCSVGTIHSSKGLEADAVILQLDLTTKIQGQLANRATREAEARTFYVGITRSKGDLWLIGRNDLVVA